MISISGGSLSVLERTRAPGLVATIAAARHLAPSSEETCRASPYSTLPAGSNSNGTTRKLVMLDSFRTTSVLSQECDCNPAVVWPGGTQLFPLPDCPHVPAKCVFVVPGRMVCCRTSVREERM